MSRILIVEDDESLRELIEVVLELQGHYVVLAENGVVAFNTLRQDARFDAIVSDIYMPEMDGLSLTRLVTHHFPKIPIIVASAYIYQIQHALKLGATRHLLKPFSNIQLAETVRAVLQAPAMASR